MLQGPAEGEAQVPGGKARGGRVVGLEAEAGLPRARALAAELADAGLDRVNISADSLKPDRVVAIARRDLHFDLVAAARAAQDAGLGPIKINVVVMRGINDDEIADFAALTRDHPWHVRFIELMPVGELRELTFDHVVPTDEILARLRAVDTLTTDAGPSRGNGPAVYYRYPQAVAAH